MTSAERRIYNVLPPLIRMGFVALLDVRDLLALTMNRRRHW